jgi:hypothetical protein
MPNENHRTAPVSKPKATSANPALSLTNRVLRLARCAPLVPLVVLALLMPACGGRARDAGGDPASTETTDAPAEQPAAAPPQSAVPPTEGTGPERPAPGVQAPPAIDIASLPIGRGSGGNEEAVRQCVTVEWLDSDIPDGISVVVTAIRVTPSGVFTVSRSGSGCRAPLCRSSFAFTADRDACSVPVVATGPAEAFAELILDGQIRCPAGRAACRDFAAKLDKRSIGLTVPGPIDAAPPAATG